MRLILAIASLFALAASTPTPKPFEPVTHPSIINIRLIGAANHYSPGNAQAPTTSRGRTLRIPVGMAIDMAESAIEVEIVSIDAGVSSSQQAVAHDDSHVVCTASLSHASRGQDFALGDRQVRLNNRAPGLLTQLLCEKRES